MVAKWFFTLLDIFTNELYNIWECSFIIKAPFSVESAQPKILHLKLYYHWKVQ